MKISWYEQMIKQSLRCLWPINKKALRMELDNRFQTQVEIESVHLALTLLEKHEFIFYSSPVNKA